MVVSHNWHGGLKQLLMASFLLNRSPQMDNLSPSLLTERQFNFFYSYFSKSLNPFSHSQFISMYVLLTSTQNKVFSNENKVNDHIAIYLR